MPFISLYKPLGSTITLVLGGVRSGTSGFLLCTNLRNGDVKEISYNLFQTSIAVASFVGTVFAHPVGMVIASAHDLITEVENLRQHVKAKDSEKAIKSCLNIINNSLYLVLLIRGGLELTVACLAMQVLMSLYHSHAELKQGHHLECGANFLMGMVRFNQLHSQIKILKLKWEIDALVKQGNLSKHDLNEIRTQELIAVIEKYKNYSFYHDCRINSSPYFKACIAGDKNAIKILLQHGFDPNSRVDPLPYYTILYFGLKYWGNKQVGLENVDKAEMFSFFIANGADVNKCHEGLKTAIFELRNTGQAGIDALKLAIQKGASLKGILSYTLNFNWESQGTSGGYRDCVVKLLLDSGAKLD